MYTFIILHLPSVFVAFLKTYTRYYAVRLERLKKCLFFHIMSFLFPIRQTVDPFLRRGLFFLCVRNSYGDKNAATADLLEYLSFGSYKCD